MAKAVQAGRVALVTGASRGAGRGIARALGAAGWTVVVTGRSVDPASHELGGSVGATADEVTSQGGLGVPIACDHADDAQVAALFARVERDFGRLDLLVNNAMLVPDELLGPEPFWEKSLAMVAGPHHQAIIASGAGHVLTAPLIRVEGEEGWLVEERENRLLDGREGARQLLRT